MNRITITIQELMERGCSVQKHEAPVMHDMAPSEHMGIRVQFAGFADGYTVMEFATNIGLVFMRFGSDDEAFHTQQFTEAILRRQNIRYKLQSL